MIPWQELGRTLVPGQSDLLVLARRGEEFVIRVGARILMSSAAHGSEEILAAWASERVADGSKTRVLIGGLGMGFTLRAALRAWPAQARLCVAELLPAVVEWNRGALAHLADRPLDDSRVRVFEGDVADLIERELNAWDAILLDVDNGPNGLTRAANDRLYSPAGLRVSMGALRAGGVLGVWSAAPDTGFRRRLCDAGFRVDERVVRARGHKGVRHTLWLATASGSPRLPDVSS